ncbi:MAG: restriction endonuclease [Anaerolineaceae bacterium]|nr:restriction endonuclease [Anaerolineaceae bacterium]
MSLEKLRESYHRNLCRDIIRNNWDKRHKRHTHLNFADKGNNFSIQTAYAIADAIGCTPKTGNISGQTAGRLFEKITKNYLEESFDFLLHLRPGNWVYSTQTEISRFVQYAHLARLEELIKMQPELDTVFGSDYIIKPDIVVGRLPVEDHDINRLGAQLTTENKAARFSPLRERNQKRPRPILHASISCKWTLRSDRAQNTRTETLNLIRNRKGPMAHASAVTAEPVPSRLSALALGTGDLDCVYHIALPELQETLERLGFQESLKTLEMLIEGERLRDISDLPLDLAI